MIFFLSIEKIVLFAYQNWTNAFLLNFIKFYLLLRNRGMSMNQIKYAPDKTLHIMFLPLMKKAQMGGRR